MSSSKWLVTVIRGLGGGAELSGRLWNSIPEKLGRSGSEGPIKREGCQAMMDNDAMTCSGGTDVSSFLGIFICLSLSRLELGGGLTSLPGSVKPSEKPPLKKSVYV